MVEFTLPKNSKITGGKDLAEAGRRHAALREFQRLSLESG